ncbi:MAG: hypothetical protein AABY22_17850 [Nanoarchaeota archaeon]
MKIEPIYKATTNPLEKVIIELTPKECSYLLEVCGNIGGNSSPRKVFDYIASRLLQIGIIPSRLICDKDGALYFSEDKKVPF